MPNETTSSEKSDHQAWSEDDVLVLLCALNDNIQTIRDAFRANREKGVASASTLLSKMVGNGFTPEQVERKIMHLWKRCGPPSAEPSSPVDPMYLTGAWTRTLPFLNALYPAMLDRVALAGKVQDRRKRDEQIRPARVKDLRPRPGDDWDDPTDCRCGFVHFASDCLHCARCKTWQHAWCYYAEDKRNPETYICDRCQEGGEDKRSATDEASALVEGEDDNLLTVLQRLQIHSHQNDIAMSRQRRTRAEQHSKYAQPSHVTSCDVDQDEDFLYGLVFEQVQSDVTMITSAISNLVHSVDTDNFELILPSLDPSGQNSELFELFQTAKVPAVTSADSFFPFLKAALASAVWNWTFCSEGPTDAANTNTRHEALLDAYRQTSLPKRDLRVLQDVHTQLWTTLTVDRPDILKPIIAKEADTLARRLLCLLSSLIRRSSISGDSRPLETAEDWIGSTRNGRQRYKLIQRLFESCIKLKNKSRLSQYFYEIHYPASFDCRFVEAEYQPFGEQHNGQRRFCLAPAILEYEPKLFQRLGSGSGALFGEQNYIRASDEQREECRTVCKALVTFR